MTDDVTSAADGDRRTLLNARGALGVVGIASETVDDGLADIDDTVSTQVDEMEAVIRAVSSLSATIEQIAASASEVDDRTTAAAAAADDGRTAVENATREIATARDRGREALDDVERLQNRVDDISAEVAGIDDIAGQTNMLALNASIEAARAGEDSDGFAVVADEIKGLAAESRQQATNVEAALEDVQAALETTVSRLEETMAALEAGVESAESTAENLGDVTDIVETASDDVSSVSSATDEQASVSESVANRCERTAERATDVASLLDEIRSARTEQTVMIREIEGRVDEATPALDPSSLAAVPTGVPSVDEEVGGLLRGGRAVVRHTDADVAGLVAGLCEAALDEGLAVSLTPPPGFDRATLRDALDGDPGRLLDADRLFVLDAFDEWTSAHNVFDLSTSSLARTNRRTAERRDVPMLVVGNIAAEISTLGERRAREARYENDEDVFGAADTVVNVVDDATVDETFGAFYAGAADQVFEVGRDGGEGRLVVLKSPTTAEGATVRVPTSGVTDK